ncbi:MAG TPA: hypothetical protein VM124_02370, partial [Candidatus Limnocylindrales bacterium]|nr:hypothetical protein [Candidatus Limnocylindrales bacterium]
DTRFKRNHVRHTILPRFSAGQRAQLLILLDDLRALNHEADRHIVNLLHSQPALDTLDRQWFILLPHSVATEVVHAWLRRYNARSLSRRTIERLVIAMKTSHPGRRVDVDQAWVLVVQSQLLALVPRDR